LRFVGARLEAACLAAGAPNRSFHSAAAKPQPSKIAQAMNISSPPLAARRSLTF